MNILHLSDLHFGTMDDARTWAGQLAVDLSGGLGRNRLDAVIISGDVATRSEPEEYAAAKSFLDALCAEFGPRPEGIVLAPGNHDLHWGLAKKGYSLMDREDFEGDLSKFRHVEVGDGVIRVRNKGDAHWTRFARFNEFHKAVKGTPYPLEPSRQGVLHHFPDHDLLILALNSCWDIDHRFPSAAGIHPHAVGFALDAIRRNADRYGDCLKFAAWHHPLDSPFEDRITDRGFISRLANAGFCAGFGHIHKAEKSLFAYDVTEDGRKLHIIGAGTFGAPSDEWHPGVPLQYNFITLEDNRLTVATRCRREKNGRGKPMPSGAKGLGKIRPTAMSSNCRRLGAEPKARQKRRGRRKTCRWKSPRCTGPTSWIDAATWTSTASGNRAAASGWSCRSCSFPCTPFLPTGNNERSNRKKTSGCSPTLSDPRISKI